MNYFKFGTPKQRVCPLDVTGLNLFTNTIKRLNGITAIYRSLYDFNDIPSQDSAIINKIFFDFDCQKDHPSKCQEDILKLSDCLVEENLSHSIFFSGDGFHLFLHSFRTLASDLKNPTQALRNVWDHYVEKTGVESDEKVRGDLVRICRFPNTINVKTGLYCIPLSREELSYPREKICEIAQKPRKSLTWGRVRGTNLIDLHDFDGEPEERNFEMMESSDLEEINEDAILNQVPLCVRAMLQSGNCNYFHRYCIIIALRDMCYSKSDTTKILQNHLDEKKFWHCVRDEDQINYLYDREDLFFPTCNRVKEEGFCVKECTGSGLYA